MRPCPACSPATRFQCDICEGSGELPEIGVTTTFQSVGDDHDGDNAPREAMDTVAEMMQAAAEYRLTMCTGPNPFKPDQDARLLFAVHPADMEAFKRGEPSRKAPLAVLLCQEDVLKMIAGARPQKPKDA